MRLEAFISALIALNFVKVEGGFTKGAPCSPLNTAYLNPTSPIIPTTVKCVDITVMGKNLTFSNTWPISSADTLYANHMNLQRISKSLFRYMPNLELVDFTGNRIRRLPFDLDGILPRLTTLLLPTNQVYIPKKRALVKSSTLKTLMLSHNRIKYLAGVTFKRVPALRVLYLDSNYLEFVTPKMFSHLTNLKYLHLGNNLLRRVPSKVYMPKSLSIYIVKGNKVKRRQKTGLGSSRNDTLLA